jgi:hypothetical protein
MMDDVANYSGEGIDGGLVYTVLYEDGEVGENVPQQHIRASADRSVETSATSNGSHTGGQEEQKDGGGGGGEGVEGVEGGAVAGVEGRKREQDSSTDAAARSHDAAGGAGGAAGVDRAAGVVAPAACVPVLESSDAAKLQVLQLQREVDWGEDED